MKNELNATSRDAINKGTIFFIISLIVVLLIQLSKITQQKSIESIMFSATFVLLLLCISLLFTKRLPNRIFLMTLWLVFQAIVSVLISSHELTFSYFNKLLFFLATVLSIFFVSFYPLNKITIQWIYRISILQSVVFIIAYIFNMTGSFGIIEAITFGFANPNFTGMWLLHVICINFVYLYEKGEKNERLKFLLILIVNVFQIYFLVLTQNRASYFGLLIFAVGLIMNKIRKNKFYSINELIVAFIPALTVILYFWLNASGRIQAFQILSSTGKALTSRIGIWREGLEVFLASPLSGDYHTVIYNLSFSQMHNVYIDLLASYGGIVAVLFFLFLLYMLKHARRRITSSQQNIAYWGITAVIMASSFEAALVSGSTGMHLMTCALFVLTNHVGERKNE
ncbi:hypothetical protein BSK62_26075 [Paenibacillus odorifer]|uniref:O-antigen ligase family protein n=1 Tax=Paenibacillus odorifer TaxID=189426 RepID=UPI00096CBA0E|nr:hypothetical protein [Paenibacillus odorifer]OMD60019.1 hypothetical protein BSK62_26075 [Paenibacillus odorifer]